MNESMGPAETMETVMPEETHEEEQTAFQEETEAVTIPAEPETIPAETERDTEEESEVSEEENGRPFDDTTPDLPPTGPALDILTPYPVIQYAATSSEAVSIGTIHNDIQLLNISFLLAFVLFFTLFLVRGWR